MNHKKSSRADKYILKNEWINKYNNDLIKYKV